MKKLSLVLLVFLVLLVLVGCSKNDSTSEVKKIKVMATAIPHAEVLDFVKPILKDEYGIDLEILVVDDYFIPNKALANGDVDANYFQHLPFFESQIQEHSFDLVSAGPVHIEPIGVFSNKYDKIEDIEEGATVILSNSVSDHGRVLAVLESAGLIKIKDGVAKVEATLNDVENTRNLTFLTDVSPAFLARAFQNNEADLVAINSNYALEAGINPLEEALILENPENNPFVNLVAVRNGDENREEIKSLMEVLQSQVVADFLIEQYNGSVIPVK